MIRYLDVHKSFGRPVLSGVTLVATDEALYDDLRAAARSLNGTSGEVASLVAAIKQNPKRYLKLSVF